METSNQKLVGVVRMSNKGTNYLNLFISKDGLDYCVDFGRGNARDFLLDSEMLKQELQKHYDNGGSEISDEEMADELSYDFLKDGDLYRAYAESVELFEDDLVEVGV